ncbi:galactose-binding domain-like protein [Auriculariales sp. MPI-PUGE-AT-0066]|nr:galactose-binding domain-like protein [Auriculariales sp. MPI-PUGE-AT-0066]
MLFVNGWQMGRYHASIGPQKAFPVHEGILNYHGKNTVVLSLWAVGNATADLSISDLQLKVDSVVRGGLPHIEPVWVQRDVY